MKKLRILLSALWLFPCLVTCVTASASNFVQSNHLSEWPSFAAFVISGAAGLCAILLIMMCASFCPKKDSTFRDLSNEEHFQDIRIEPPSTDFIMLPPMIDTADGGSNGPIRFEPLPNISALRRQHLAKPLPDEEIVDSTNESQLRPRIAQIGHDRVENDEEIECLPGGVAMLQERVKLEKLLSNMHHNISRGQLQYIREMGSGWFGKVFLADGQDLVPGHKKTRVVIQSIHETSDEHCQHSFLQEAAVFREMEHQNVLKMFGHCVETTPLLTILEFCPLGDVKMYLRNRRSDHDILDKQGLLLNMACDMASGLQALHQNNFVHRDFAIRNCLVSAELTVKVGDYGLAEQMYKDDYYIDKSGYSIPLRWLAPEVVCVRNGSVVLRHGTKDSNLWSFGVALWELVTFGALPYGDLNNEQVIRQVLTDGATRLSLPEVPVSNVEKLFQLMSLCWLAPALRPSLRELRIMLLHLRSSRDELDTSTLADFDRKWNQLMPRHANSTALLSTVTVDSEDEDSVLDMDFTLDDRVPRNNTDSYAADMHLGMRMAAGGRGAGLGAMLSNGFVRPSSFDSQFSNELNASLLAQAGSLQTSLRSFSALSSPSNTPDDFTPGVDSAVFNVTVPHFAFGSSDASLVAAAEPSAVSLSSTFEIVPHSQVHDRSQPLSGGSNFVTRTGSSGSLSASSLEQDVKRMNEKLPSGKIESLNSDGFVTEEDNWQGFTGSALSSVIDEQSRRKDNSDENVTNRINRDNPHSELSVVEAKSVLDSSSNGSKETSCESFLILETPNANGSSLITSTELASPSKSTNSSTDWCLVSNSPSEISKEDEFEGSTRIVDHNETNGTLASTEILAESRQQSGFEESDCGHLSNHPTESVEPISEG